MNDYGYDYCWQCKAWKPVQIDSAMGENGIWLWKDPPFVLYEGKGFWIFFKNAYWVCDTPEDVHRLKSFCPQIDHVNGNLTSWVNEKYSKQHPFLNEYDQPKGINYGLLNRLDRETSGPVVVAKDESTFWKLRRNRDGKSWFKEYMCLVHGRVPVEVSQGVLENYMVTDSKGSKGHTRVVDEWRQGADKAITIYQVRSYHKWKNKKFTLMKVRIVTGKRHQIRVHMHHFLKSLGTKIGANEDYGLVSDFMYLNAETAKEDKKSLCDRVFLHARLLGMWDPEDYNRLVVVKARMPTDLEKTLEKIDEDRSAMKALRKHREGLKNNDPFGIESFCQNYGLNARERSELLHGKFWKERSFCVALMDAFRARAGDGLETLSIDGDHSFLMECIRKDLEYEGDVQKCDFDKWLEKSLRYQIDDRLWWQKQAKMAAAPTNLEDLPDGWRKIAVKDVAYYLHEGGLSSRNPPVVDANVPKGWSKFLSEDGAPYYTSHARHRTIWHLPTVDDMLPPGWEKVHSRSDHTVVYYLHTETGKTQRGLPCEGSLEDLPPGWEKCASRKQLGDYYFHSASETTQFDTPLPPGWRISSRGYKHTDGCFSLIKPLFDSRVPHSWTKFSSKSQGGRCYYMCNKDSTRTQWELPSE